MEETCIRSKNRQEEGTMACIRKRNGKGKGRAEKKKKEEEKKKGKERKG